MTKLKWRSWLREAPFLLAPLLVGLYPVLFLYNRNIDEVPFAQVTRPLWFVVIVTIGLGWLLASLTKDRLRVGLSLSVTWLFFFFYGPFFDRFAKGLSAWWQFGLWLVLLGLILLVIWRIKHIDGLWLRAAMVFGGALVTFQLIGIVGHQRATSTDSTNYYQYLAQPTNSTLPAAAKNRPNIYFLMLDGYPRLDTLKQYFKYDNRDWDNFLKANGFYVVTRSHSNYNQTFFSMPSTLNMSYWGNFEEAKGQKHAVQTKLFLKNKVGDFLQSGGYQLGNNTIIPSTWDNPYVDFNSDCKISNQFVDQFSKQTLLRPFKLFERDAQTGMRNGALCVIKNMTSVLNRPSPKFVFSHLIPPHPPYLFGANGEDIHDVNLDLEGATRWRAKGPYVAQLKYVNQRIKAVVEELVKRDPGAVVIIQSDHGTLSSSKTANPLSDKRPIVLKERGRSFSAIRLPDSCQKDGLYPTMTNVNTFRVIFNACFGTHYKLLPDKEYYTNGLVIHEEITKTLGND